MNNIMNYSRRLAELGLSLVLLSSSSCQGLENDGSCDIAQDAGAGGGGVGGQ